jgi:hypothetical protein
MKTNTQAFTLIEMIVWVGLTIILMVSVWIFVSSWMSNITLQKQVIDQNNEIWDFNENLNNIFWENVEIINLTSTSLLVKSNHTVWKPQYYDISTVVSTWYCKNDLTRENKYLQIKNFNPFVLSGTTYSGSYRDHVIYSGWEIIAGKKWVFWDQFTSGDFWTGVYLNNPSWIAFWWWKLYISESGNNRISYMSWNKIYSFLDINDWIYHPTWLLYTWSTLYILNSGKNELLTLHSKSSLSIPIDITFQPENNINVNKITIEVLPNDFNIPWSYNSWSFIFANMSKNSWDIVNKTSNMITYFFIWWIKNLISWNSYNIKIPLFTWTPSSWVYYLKLNLLNWVNVLYEKYFPYIVNWDNDLSTWEDNTLSVLTWWLNKNFTNISLLWWNILLKDYIKWEYLQINPTTWAYISTWILTSSIDDFEIIKTLSEFKVKSFDVKQDGKLLTIKLEYYKIFSCYNDNDHVIKTILIKKSLSY